MPKFSKNPLQVYLKSLFNLFDFNAWKCVMISKDLSICISGLFREYIMVLKIRWCVVWFYKVVSSLVLRD